MQEQHWAGLLFLLKAPSKKAVNDVFVATYNNREEKLLPEKLVQVSAEAFKITEKDVEDDVADEEGDRGFE